MAGELKRRRAGREKERRGAEGEKSLKWLLVERGAGGEMN